MWTWLDRFAAMIHKASDPEPPIRKDLVRSQFPESIRELSEIPAQNRPAGYDSFSARIVDDHLRLCYAFIAQLQRQIDELKGLR